jgi:hypothetical protein
MGVRRPELVLAAAVLICLPMLPGVLHGGVSTTTAVIRFIGAILICWVAGAILSNLLTRYDQQSRRAEITRLIEQAKATRARADSGNDPRAPTGR